jgi:hypothetical protein
VSPELEVRENPYPDMDYVYGDYASLSFGEDLNIEWDAESGGLGDVLFLLLTQADDIENDLEIECRATYDVGGFTIPWDIFERYLLRRSWWHDFGLINYDGVDEVVDGVRFQVGSSSVNWDHSLEIIDTRENPWP